MLSRAEDLRFISLFLNNGKHTMLCYFLKIAQYIVYLGVISCRVSIIIVTSPCALKCLLLSLIHI